MNEKKYEKLRGLTLTLVLMYGAVCIAITLAAPELLKIFAPESYAKGVYIVPPIAAVSFLSALYNVYGNVEFYHKKSFGIALATVVSALANIALNLILIPKFSYIGAAYTYFNMDNAAAVNERIDAIIGADYEANNAPVFAGSAEKPTVGLSGVTYVLDATPTLRFALPDGADASKVEAKLAELTTK